MPLNARPDDTKPLTGHQAGSRHPYAGRVKTTRLKITLQEVAPSVVRVIDVPASTTLPELHDLLQIVLGWTNSHLHQFVTDTTSYGLPSEDDDWMEQQDEASARVKDLPQRFTYLYDFGDGWTHDVEVLGVGGDRPACVYGEGNCPPEDCGGPHGYTELLQVLANPGHEDHAQMRAWVGAHRNFDLAEADLLLRRTVGEPPESVRILLDLLKDGVKLTPGGRLPRAIVRSVQEHRPGWYPLERPASIEEDLFPLLALHELLREVGLLRLRNRVLSPTKAASDDLEITRRLRSWFRPDGFDVHLAERAIALLVVNGPLPLNDLAAAVRPQLGFRWSVDGRALTEADVSRMLNRLSSTLEALDLVEADHRTWRAGPSARSLLPGATALAQIYQPA